MAETRTLYIDAEHAAERWSRAREYVRQLLAAGKPVRLRIDEKQCTRTLDQNALMWAVLTDIARQVQWPVDGKLQWLDAEEWKHILSAGLKRQQRVAQGIDGGFVILGQRTSRMTIPEMSELIELAYAFGAEHGVTFADGRRAAE